MILLCHAGANLSHEDQRGVEFASQGPPSVQNPNRGTNPGLPKLKAQQGLLLQQADLPKQICP